MLLKELIELTGIKLSLSKYAEIIEIDDSFKDDLYVESQEEKISIYTNDNDITRLVNFDLTNKTITELFQSTLFVGGTVYSFDGELISMIN